MYLLFTLSCHSVNMYMFWQKCFYLNIITTQLRSTELKWEQDRERCSAVQVDRLEKACRQQLAHCALLNKASHFMTPPLSILILILFPSLQYLSLSHFPFLRVFCHKKLWIFFSFVFEFLLCLSSVCLFTHVFLNTGKGVRVGLMRWGEGGKLA